MSASSYIRKHDKALIRDENFRNTVLKRAVQKLLDRGEIHIDTVPRGSNYTSFVFPGEKKAYQVFVAPETLKIIKSIVNSIPKTITTRIFKSFGFGRNRRFLYNVPLDYKTSDYLPFVGEDVFEDIMEWQKITPFNVMTKAQESIIIQGNFDKFCWDINKALFALHEAGYTHGDTRIDNMGINLQGNFCLFDFDLTKKSTEKMRDFDVLNQSLKSRGVNKKVPPGLNKMVEEIYDRNKGALSGQGIVDYLNTLKLEISQLN